VGAQASSPGVVLDTSKLPFALRLAFCESLFISFSLN
jgi:hypothetical protein